MSFSYRLYFHLLTTHFNKKESFGLANPTLKNYKTTGDLINLFRMVLAPREKAAPCAGAGGNEDAEIVPQ